MTTTITESAPRVDWLPVLRDNPAAFVAAWEGRYDERNHDEREYQKLVKQVVGERANGGVTIDTFAAILLWKWKALGWARNARHLRLQDYDLEYAPALSEARPGVDGLRSLIRLHGLRAPTASTVLHFLYPEKAPIIDVRTAEVLNAAGLVATAGTEERHYGPFCDAIAEIRRRCGERGSLRRIDRALFAYHQLNGGRTR